MTRVKTDLVKLQEELTNVFYSIQTLRKKRDDIEARLNQVTSEEFGLMYQVCQVKAQIDICQRQYAELYAQLTNI